ncbi:MAG: acylphosphatase [Moorellales bacterium]
MAEPRQAHLYLRGHVQGVGMRDYVQRKARALGLVGFVRNLRDGRVEVVAEGREDLLVQLIAELRGAPVGRVEELEEEYLPASGQFVDFRVVSTV